MSYSGGARGLTVLVIDSIEGDRTVLARALGRRYGCSVVDVGTVEVDAALEAQDPDLVFVGVSNANRVGVTLVETLRCHPRHRDLPIVVVSDSTDRALVQEMLALGVTDYLLKPVEVHVPPNRFDRAVRVALARKGLSLGATASAVGARAGVTALPRRVLVIGNHLAAEKVLDALSPLGYGVLRARSGDEGLKFLGQHRVDLVIVDPTLAVSAGTDLVSALRHRYRSAKIVAMSESAEARARAQTSGAQGTIGVPFTSGELQDAVSSVLRTRSRVSTPGTAAPSRPSPLSEPH